MVRHGPSGALGGRSTCGARPVVPFLTKIQTMAPGCRWRRDVPANALVPGGPSLSPSDGTCASGRGARTTSGARHPGVGDGEDGTGLTHEEPLVEQHEEIQNRASPPALESNVL